MICFLDSGFECSDQFFLVLKYPASQKLLGNFQVFVLLFFVQGSESRLVGFGEEPF